MTKKFNLYQELQNHGFRAENDNCLVRDDFESEVEVAWYGKTKTTMAVEIWFNEDKTSCRAYYYLDQSQGRRFRPYKVKTHLSEKRAFNAIKQTVENKGYEF